MTQAPKKVGRKYYFLLLGNKTHSFKRKGKHSARFCTLPPLEPSRGKVSKQQITQSGLDAEGLASFPEHEEQGGQSYCLPRTPVTQLPGEGKAAFLKRWKALRMSEAILGRPWRSSVFSS